MEYANQGLKLWYGTADAPAPLDDVIQPRRGNMVVVGVQPADPLNAVTVEYRVDDGPIRALRAAKFKKDFLKNAEYFRAQLPDFWKGNRVAYLPVATCAQGRTPSLQGTKAFSSSFRLADQNADVASQSQTTTNRQEDPIKFSLDYLYRARVPLKSPELIGVTPEGIMVDWYWYPAEGVVKGPKLNGKVRRIGGDWMTIRRDGIGLMDVKAVIETQDAALILVEYSGYFDLGKNGYNEFLAHRWPERAPTRTTPRFHTSHANYIWLNRLQATGVGEVRMKKLEYVYDVYALR
jgi:Protein of unknown function (DUF3237)